MRIGRNLEEEPAVADAGLPPLLMLLLLLLPATEVMRVAALAELLAVAPVLAEVVEGV